MSGLSLLLLSRCLYSSAKKNVQALQFLE
uniref:Uncharacterized protein n=1 Tax=Anguilla anguilla TaxID=7936 RepID=A0A0E9V686_ANGAN